LSMFYNMSMFYVYFYRYFLYFPFNSLCAKPAQIYSCWVKIVVTRAMVVSL